MTERAVLRTAEMVRDERMVSERILKNDHGWWWLRRRIARGWHAGRGPCPAASTTRAEREQKQARQVIPEWLKIDGFHG